ncbi:neuronal PAS domain-containing protein 4 [Pithys albifrons albifrons]|uniref:neuronal PAS domain-containing protein 4 n=1 Tax=Pithys albifrons albifrons TaxID=3385563 RepID=UPI003A5CE1A3
MTIFCSHCHQPLQAEMSCPPRRGKQAPRASRPFRSTKSASKARRDQINAELQALRSLLPISIEEKERLSYLHTMALVCLRLRGAQLFPPGSAPPMGPALGTELLSLLPGFLLVLSASGKLVYISENVAQVLGLSVVELLAQGDTVFDILDGRACEDVYKKLLLAQQEPGREVTFVSEMCTSKAFRLQHGGNRVVTVCGRFVTLSWPPSPSTTAFLALCTPVMQSSADGKAGSQDDIFHSTHILDMTFIDVTESVTYHLGYRREELVGQSWYSLLHPEDADLAAAQHRALAFEAGAGAAAGAAVLRVLRRDCAWVWLRVWARREGGSRCITCTCRCLREEEAAHLRARQRRAAAPPAGPEVGRVAVQLRALADSLLPPAAAPPGPPPRTLPEEADASDYLGNSLLDSPQFLCFPFELERGQKIEWNVPSVPSQVSSLQRH